MAKHAFLCNAFHQWQHFDRRRHLSSYERLAIRRPICRPLGIGIGRWVGSMELLGGGALRGSEGHPAAAPDDDLASEKGHLLAKRALFSTITGGGGGPAPR